MEDIIIAIIVTVAFVWTSWVIYGKLTGKKSCVCSKENCCRDEKCNELFEDDTKK